MSSPTPSQTPISTDTAIPPASSIQPITVADIPRYSDIELHAHPDISYAEDPHSDSANLVPDEEEEALGITSTDLAEEQRVAMLTPDIPETIEEFAERMQLDISELYDDIPLPPTG